MERDLIWCLGRYCMNKLRKKPPPRQNLKPDLQSSIVNAMSTAAAITPALQSRTMALARTTIDVLPTSSPSKHSNLATTYAKSRQQMTTSEQYWAARALTAETMLSASAHHQRELRSMTEVEQIKRTVRLIYVVTVVHALNDIRKKLLP